MLQRDMRSPERLVQGHLVDIFQAIHHSFHNDGLLQPLGADDVAPAPTGGGAHGWSHHGAQRASWGLAQTCKHNVKCKNQARFSTTNSESEQIPEQLLYQRLDEVGT